MRTSWVRISCDVIKSIVQLGYNLTKFNKKTINFDDLFLGSFYETEKTNYFQYIWNLKTLISDSFEDQNDKVDGFKIFSFNTDENTRNKTIEIVFSISSKQVEFKIELNYGYCENIFVEDINNDEAVNIYLKLSMPPKFFISYYSDDEYVGYLYNDKWERIPNFAIPSYELLDRIEQDYINNNLVIKLKFNKSRQRQEQKFQLEFFYYKYLYF